LTTARELARRGLNVVVLEANRAGWGASGRNAGFVLSGFAVGMPSIAERTGLTDAQAMCRHSIEGVDYVRHSITELCPDAMLGIGEICATRIANDTSLREHVAQMADEFSYPLDYLDTGAVRQRLRTNRYHAGISDPTGFHINPLRYVMALATAAEQAGAVIYEGSPARSIDHQPDSFTITTPQGTVRARHIVLATSAYGRKLYRPFAGTLVPVATYIAATQAMDDETCRSAICTDAAISDTRRAGDYYRVVPGRRILWGGRITTRTAEPARLAEVMRHDMTDVYPQLAHVAMHHAWSGLMAYFRHAMPVIGQLQPGTWSATGFGGHGLNTTAMAGNLIARAIADGDDAYRRFHHFGPDWAGGPFAPLAAQAKYWFMQWRDKRDERTATNQP
jgi:glycine/D-amino acid oxidase-like deaminating enzyme